MPSPQLFRIQGKSYTVDELGQTIVNGIVDAVDLRVEQTVNDLADATATLVENMYQDSAFPRVSVAKGTQAVSSSSYKSPRLPGMQDIVVIKDLQRRDIKVGKYRGRIIASGTIFANSGRKGIDNEFNAMDTGIPAREAKNSPYMRFPRYEGTVLSRHGSLDTHPIRVGNERTSVTVDTHGRVVDNWVTVKRVAASQPFNLFDRLRRQLRGKQRKIAEIERSRGNYIDLSKIRIRVSGILED